MSPAAHVILCGALSFGAPLVLAIYELMTMRPAGADPSRRSQPAPVAPTPPSANGAYRKPLPACLMPAPRAATPERVLEPA
jgi:hypothetical protein